MMLSFCIHAFNCKILMGSQPRDSEVMLSNAVESIAYKEKIFLHSGLHEKIKIKIKFFLMALFLMAAS